MQSFNENLGTETNVSVVTVTIHLEITEYNFV